MANFALVLDTSVSQSACVHLHFDHVCHVRSSSGFVRFGAHVFLHRAVTLLAKVQTQPNPNCTDLYSLTGYLWFKQEWAVAAVRRESIMI